MPPQNRAFKLLRSSVSKVPLLINAYRASRDFLRTDCVATAMYRKAFERKRLRLVAIAPEQLSRAAGDIVLPTEYPLFGGEDAPLNDMLFLLNAAKGRNAQRILEVGTYRARTTLALHLNCPAATLVSYDIQVVLSPYRTRLESAGNVELRHRSFAASAAELQREPKFEIIFVDGSHRARDVIEDSLIAFEVASPGGLIVWHDYRLNDYPNRCLQVPEALQQLMPPAPIFAVSGTWCAACLVPDRSQS